MSQKTDTKRDAGFLAGVRSFVHTVVVVALGFALLTALWTGGLDGVAAWLTSALNWLLALCERLVSVFSDTGSALSR